MMAAVQAFADVYVERPVSVDADEANVLLARPCRAPWIHPDPSNV